MTSEQGNPPDQEIDDLQRDIDDTRHDMEDTLEAIEEQIHPRNVALRQKHLVQQRLKEVQRQGSQRVNDLRNEATKRTEDVPVVPVAGATAGLAAITTLAGLMRRRQMRIRTAREHRTKNIMAGLGLGMLATVAVVNRLVKSRGSTTATTATPLLVRDIMTGSAASVSRSDTLLDTVRRMRDLDVGGLPVCGKGGRVQGMLTDRDVVIKAVAKGRALDRITAGKITRGRPVTVAADATALKALRTMSRHKVRRLPVTDGGKLVGVLSQADIAKHLGDDQVGALIESISAAR